MSEKDFLSDEGAIYCWSCASLEAVLSAFHYLEDYFEAEEIDKLFSVWSDNYYNLIEWLQEEIFFPLDHEQISLVRRRQIYKDYETSGDKIIKESIEIISQIIDDQSKNSYRNSNIYFCYLQWLANVLLEFDVLLQAIKVSEYLLRYKNNISKFKTLEAKISEQLNSKNLEIIDDLKNDLIVCATKLALSWRQTVTSNSGRA